VESRRSPAGANPARPIGRSAGSRQNDGGGNESVEVLWCNGSSTVSRLSHFDLNRIDLNSVPIATYFQHPSHSATPKAKAILVQAGQVEDELELDDEVIEGLVVGLGS
jgi:hypothetical protein